MPPNAPIAQPRPFEVLSPFGVRSDPYYWLRDDARTDPDAIGYLAAENAYCDEVMAPLARGCEALYRELVGRLKPDDTSVPYRKEGAYYYTRFEAGQEFPLYARRRGSLTAPEEILLDPNAARGDSEYYDVGSLEVSPDGERLAYAEDRVGRRQYDLRVKDLATGQPLADHLEQAEPDVVWTADGASFLYIAKDPDTLLGRRVLRHRLGTPASADERVYEEPDPGFYLSLARSKSGRFLYILLSSTVSSEVRFARSDDPELGFKVAIPRARDHEYPLEDHGDRFILRTNRNAENFRIVSARIDRVADETFWEELVPTRPDAFIAGFELFPEHLVVAERSDALAKLRVVGLLDRKTHLIEADEAAYVMGFGANEEPSSHTLRYVYASPKTPRTTYDYDLTTGTRVLLKRDPVEGGFDPDRYQVELIEAPARDGERIPVSLLYRGDLRRDGTAPLYQYAYGAYGYSSEPGFRPSVLSLVDRGFVYAIAHVRGGQERGRRWYDAGRLMMKRHSFDDFVDVTRHLVRERYVDPTRVCGTGGSAGGLLIGAVANVAPDEYRALVAHVPFVDIVTTMLDDSIPLTTNEYDEWGDPASSREVYEYLCSYAPYDNVGAHDYPALYVATGLHDSQVQYWEPAKWVARLRAMKTDARPLVLRTELDAGHGGKPGRFEQYREIAEEYAFVLDQVGLTSELQSKEMKMKLYYKAGACSLASQIALRELGLSFEMESVDLAKKKTASGADFWTINPKGYVPALTTDRGEVLTEGAVILQYVADLKPEAGLAPPAGSLERYRLQEWLGYVNSEVHKSFSPLFDPTAPEPVRERARTLLARRLEYPAKVLASQPYLLGSQFTVADAYLYTVLGWAPHVGVDLTRWPSLVEYHARIAARPAVQAAHAAEKAG